MFQTCPTTASPPVEPSWAPVMPATIHALHTHCLASPLAVFLPTTLQPVIASTQSSIFDDCAPPLYLHLHDLRCIHALQLVAREGVACNITNAPFDEITSCDIDMACVVYHLQDDDDSNNNVVSMIDHMKKTNNDHNNVVLMIDHAEAALIADNTKKNNMISTTSY